MAWMFSLSAECGSELAAEQFSSHFNHVPWVLSSGESSAYRTKNFQDLEENWWCQVSPDHVSEIGVDTPVTAYQLTEIGISLYQHLRSVPTFHYALVGVEVDEFRTYSELLEESLLDFPGLVLTETIWQKLGSPPAFRSFSPGYVWKPYEGEVYKPLMGSLALRKKLDELFVIR